MFRNETLVLFIFLMMNIACHSLSYLTNFSLQHVLLDIRIITLTCFLGPFLPCFYSEKGSPTMDIDKEWHIKLE